MKSILVILPGWGGNEGLWQHQCHHLSDLVEPRVVVVSDRDTPAGMVEAILGQLPEKSFLVGHSLGGWMAQRLALEAPERVERLVLLGTSTGGVGPELAQLMRRMSERIRQGDAKALLEELRPGNVHPSRHGDLELMDQIRHSNEAFPTAGLMNQNQVCIEFRDTADHPGTIRCPTLILHGRQDAYFNLAQQEAMRDRIPGSRLVEVEDAGHLLSVERPQAVTALLRLWFQP